MIPNSASKLLGSLGSTNSAFMVKTIQGALTGAQVRNESLLCSVPTKKIVCQPGAQNGAQGIFDVGQKRNDSSCFAGSQETMCSTNSKFGCGNRPPPASTQMKQGGSSIEHCGFGKPKEIECPDELCIQKCCPKSCRIVDPCCPDKCGHIECEKEPEIKCCNKRECCPHEDYGRNQCCKEVPQPRVHRCDRPDACHDPCCSRVPICRNKSSSLVECDEFLGDALERPCPPDPCDAKGSACQFASSEDDCCEMKLKKDACDIKGCPRKTRCVKKRKINGNNICLNLDPNWPPKRPCNGEPQKDPCTQCQRDCNPKKKFDDGLC